MANIPFSYFARQRAIFSLSSLVRKTIAVTYKFRIANNKNKLLMLPYTCFLIVTYPMAYTTSLVCMHSSDSWFFKSNELEKFVTHDMKWIMHLATYRTKELDKLNNHFQVYLFNLLIEHVSKDQITTFWYSNKNDNLNYM